MDALAQEQVTFAAPMAEPTRKAMHFASATLQRSRNVDGKSVKRG